MAASKKSSMLKRFTYGPTKYSSVAELAFAHYGVGNKPEMRIALSGIDPETGERLHTCTVNFPDIDVTPQCVWIKSWSENEGMLEALIKAKIGTTTGRSVRAGHVHAYELKLHPQVWMAARAKVDEETKSLQKGSKAKKAK